MRSTAVHQLLSVTETMRPTVTGRTGIAPQQAGVITTFTSQQQQVVVPGQTLCGAASAEAGCELQILNTPIYLRILVKKKTNQTKQRDSAQVTQILLSAHSSFGFDLTLTVQYSGTTVYLQV